MIVRYHELARSEVIEAARYYAGVGIDLAVEFLAEMDAAETRIDANPQ